MDNALHYRALLQAERLAAVGQAIAALSHHIKNILQGLRSGGDLLNAGIRDKDEQLLQHGWRIVERNQSRIYDLVLDMLSYSKEREPVHEPVNLHALVAEVVELMKPRAVELGAELRVETSELPILIGDPEAIHRAILNLVGNALDAVAGRSRPVVEITTERSADGAWAVVAVADNGIGIAPEQMPDLFKPFVSSKGSRGTGLGLAVSRKTAREHGGDITVQSTPDVGSVFTLKLPLASPAGE